MLVRSGVLIVDVFASYSEVVRGGGCGGGHLLLNHLWRRQSHAGLEEICLPRDQCQMCPGMKKCPGLRKITLLYRWFRRSAAHGSFIFLHNQFNKQLISPKEFVCLAGKSTLKDWKRAIRLNGTMLRSAHTEPHLVLFNTYNLFYMPFFLTCFTDNIYVGENQVDYLFTLAIKSVLVENVVKCWIKRGEFSQDAMTWH